MGVIALIRFADVFRSGCRVQPEQTAVPGRAFIEIPFAGSPEQMIFQLIVKNISPLAAERAERLGFCLDGCGLFFHKEGVVSEEQR